MADYTIYHNPRCSKSREGLKILQEAGIEPEIIKYLDDPPSVNELREILEKLDMDAIDIVRRREQEYKDLNLKEKKDDEEALIRAMAEHPRLIQRPIVVSGDRAALGRPPENIKALF
ncbi:MAG: arsenate reductase (glutaredoxin) [Candidatus Marinimicrobia bacterium]|nr:arsenate reductase (glutaredoxin) [Candidatus Neomarinimicrobiota bacterium]MCF7828544.1 arsenate reductase (glutaredoxin) [Candidatus Neomarinimicrobiota bacterium]MCF7882033.1 arsenate reductase (glutaredoxin) [Candidatus Neomarinimicrobiota bacterium]